METEASHFHILDCCLCCCHCCCTMLKRLRTPAAMGSKVVAEASHFHIPVATAVPSNCVPELGAAAAMVAEAVKMGHPWLLLLPCHPSCLLPPLPTSFAQSLAQQQLQSVKMRSPWLHSVLCPFAGLLTCLPLPPAACGKLSPQRVGHVELS